MNATESTNDDDTKIGKQEIYAELAAKQPLLRV